MSKKNISRAYTLFEMSIVVVILSIIVVALIKGSQMVNSAQLASARALTMSSPVNSIPGLVLWYETTLESSFAPNEAINNSTVSNWYDASNNGRSKKMTATQSTTSQKPLYIEGAFSNNIPGIRFDGSNDTFTLPALTALVGKSFSIFMVEQKRRAAITNNHILTINGTSYNGFTNCCIFMGWLSDTSFGLDRYNYSTALTTTSFSYTQPTPRMHTGILDINSGTKYWLNGGSTADGSGGGKSTLPSVAGLTSYLGKSCCGAWYYGDVGELIIFNRNLTTDERQAVETYLSQKFNITIS